MCNGSNRGFSFFLMKYTILINQYAAVKHGLNLDLIDLAIFDFIKDFANSSNCVKMQTPEGVFFWISHKLVMEAMPLLNIKTNQGLMKRIENLINAGILRKHPNCDKYRQTLYAFGDNYDLLAFTNADFEPKTKVDNPQQKFRETPNESLGITPNKSLGYNINNIDNNINDNKPENEFSGLFPEAGVAGNEPKLRGTTEPHKCLFANSRFAKFEDFEKCFDKPEYEQIDILYYYHSVADWSASKGRMQKDWIAQTRNFIRGDKEKGKLHLKSQYDNKPQGIDIAGAMEFLNNDF